MSIALTASGVVITCGLLAASALSPRARADPPPNVPRIGVLNPQSAPQFEEYLRKGLRELGYVDGQNIIIEWRRGVTPEEQIRAQAAEMTRRNVAVIVALGTPATRAALEATAKPVVMQVGDPIRAGCTDGGGGRSQYRCAGHVHNASGHCREERNQHDSDRRCADG